jgi:hypothetical protein
MTTKTSRTAKRPSYNARAVSKTVRTLVDLQLDIAMRRAALAEARKARKELIQKLARLTADAA